MAKKLFFASLFVVGSFLITVPVLAQTCPHIYEGINCGANWYCNGCQATCKICPGGGDPVGATELNYVSCSCGCPSGKIVCNLPPNTCITPPACSTPTRENAATCNGCGACKAGYSSDPAAPDAPNPCLKTAYIDYANTGYFQVSGNITSTGGDVGGTRLCIGVDCRATWPEAVSAFVDEGNVGFGPTAVLGTNDNIPLSFETNNVGRVYIDTAGNVGIGTTGPASRLSVSGGASIGSGYATTSAPADGMIIQGNVGIGTTNTTYKLMVAGTAPRLYLLPTPGTNSELNFGSPAMDSHWAIYRDTATDQLRFWRTDNRMVITSGGNVGIGATSPAYKLDVAGQANAQQLCIAGDCRASWPVTSPGGSDTQVQFNDGGTFGGDAGLIYNKTTDALAIGGVIGVNGLGANPTIGVSARGSTSGGYFADSGDSGFVSLGSGNYGVDAYGSDTAVRGLGGTYGVYGNGTSYGVYGASNNAGVYGSGSVYGVYGTTSSAVADAGYFLNTNSSTYARLGYSTWGGYFGGNLYATGNLTVGGGSPSNDDYIYFDDGIGTKYLQWKDSSDEFRFSNSVFSFGGLSGTQLTVREGGYNQAVDLSNTKSIVMRHMDTYGLLETQSSVSDAGNLVLRSDTDYPADYVEIADELRINSTLTLLGVGNFSNDLIVSGNVRVGGGSYIVYRCVDGAPANEGALVVDYGGGEPKSFCGGAGTFADSGLRVK